MADLVKVIDVRANVGDAEQKLGKLQSRVKQLQDRKKRLTKDVKAGKISQDRYNKAMGRTTIQMKKAQMGVRQYSKSILVANGAMAKTSGFVMGIRKALTGMAGQFLGVMAAFMLVRNVIGIFKDFEQANADLAAVLGATREEITELSEDAKRLGAITAFTASEVSQLQKEFAKLGFSTDEIINATKATLDLAAATGTELPRAAEVVGSTIRAFGLDASEAQRVTDVMAKSFSSSALDMEKFATSMRSVAPVAKSAGLNIERTTSMLGVLVDRGIDASTAGTSLRNVFLQLTKKGLTFEEAMEKINTSTNKNKTALELFGKRGVATGLILASTGDDAARLEEKLNNAGGAAEQMAKTQLNTLEGAMTILNSAWQGFILSLEDGNGQFATTLKNIIKVTTEVLTLATGTGKAREELDEAGKTIRDSAENVMTLLRAIKFVVKAWITYKAIMIGARIATIAYTAVTTALRIAKIALARGIGSATKAMKLFNVASRANIIGAIATALVLAASSMYDYFTATEKTVEAVKKLTEAEEELKRAQLSDADIKKRVEVRGAMSKKGLEQLEEDIQQEINLLQSKVDKGKANEAEFIKSRKVFFEEKARVETELQKRIDNKESELVIKKQRIKLKKLEDFHKEEIAAKGGSNEKTENHLRKHLEGLELVRAEMRSRENESEDLNNKEITDKQQKELDKRAKERENAEQKRLEQQQKYQQLRLQLATQEAAEKTKALFDGFLEDKKISALKDKARFEEMESKAELRMLEAETLDEERLASIDKENAEYIEKRAAQKLRVDATDEERKAHNTKIELLEAQHTKKLEDIETKFEKLKQENRQKSLQAASNVIGALAGLAEEGSATSKALMSAQALINTYAAITGQLAAFSTVPVPGYAIAQAIATGIMGFAQVAKINGVKFAEGGVLRGKSHARGGIPTIDGQYEFEGGEAVINKRSTAKYGALLSGINQAGGGIAFEKGGITKFQDGGINAPISFPDVGTDATGVADQLTAQMGAIKVVNVVSDTTDQQNSILNVQSEAEFG